MKNYNEWEPLVGAEERYKIRMAEDNKTVEILGPSGKILLFSKGNSGYNGCAIYYKVALNTRMAAHQLSYKQWVEKEYLSYKDGRVLDHIDSDKDNNHPSNLRLVTQRENIGKEKSNKRGIPQGVYKEPSGRYRAMIFFNKKRHSIGMYNTATEAAQAYQDALNRLNNNQCIRQDKFTPTQI